MMLIITCARGGGGGGGKFDKMVQSGAFWVFQSYVIINLKINICFDNKSTTQILCHIFL